MANLLIVGSNGIIGSELKKNLNKLATLFLMGHGQSNDDNYFQLDLTDNHEVKSFTKNCPYFSVIVFLVGLAHKKGNKRDLEEFKSVNFETLKNFLIGLKNNKKVPDKIIFASTISVYGESLIKKNFHEETDLNPVSPYAKTKKEAEDYLKNNFLVNSWILRFAPVYSSKFLLNLNRRIRFFSIPFRVSDGSVKLSLCNIENITIIIKSIINGDVPNGIYNVSDRISYSYNDILSKLDIKFFIQIPAFFFKISFYVGKIFGNIFILENSIKLLSDNLFTSDKISKYVELKFNLKDSL